MTEVAKAVEVVETTAEMAAPVVADGTLDAKKVAMYAAATLAVAGCTYAVYRLIKKRKEADVPEEVIVINPTEVVPEEEPVVEETPSAEKKKQKK